MKVTYWSNYLFGFNSMGTGMGSIGKDDQCRSTEKAIPPLYPAFKRTKIKALSNKRTFDRTISPRPTRGTT